MDDLRAELERVREELLDLSLRNPLLNFKAYSRSTVETRDELPREVYRRLVLQGRKMAFVPDDESDAPTDGDPDLLWELPPPGAELEDHHTDRFLETPHTDRDLQKRLFHIDNKARTLVEDAGYNALHLAVGFLEWREEADADEIRRAPLILIPVQLEREQATSSFKLQWTGQDLDTNLSLKIRLQDRGIELPEFEMPEDRRGVYQYLETVSDRVDAMSDWEVVPDVALGFFRFTNLSMYKDLDPEEWPEDEKPHQNDLVRAILDPTETDAQTGTPDVDVAELDPRGSNHVLDADPSQAAVIEAVKDGHNLVVEGPPGTGKSQTIVNLIAELIAQNKKVLFVSEKKAALEVVHGKLDAAGLGDFCLELHSHKANKAETLAELQRVAFQEPSAARNDGDLYDDLAETTAQLDGYVDAIREAVEETGLGPYELICQRQEAHEHFDADERSLPIVELPEAVDIDADERRRVRSLLGDLVEAIGPVWPVDEHPWRGTDPGNVLPRKRRRVEEHLDEAREATQATREALDALAGSLNVETPATPAQARRLVEAADRLLEADEADPDRVLATAWEDTQRAERLIKQVTEASSLAETVRPRFRERAFQVDLNPIRRDYRKRSASFFKWLNPKYWQARARVRDLYSEDPPSARASLLEDLDELARYRELEARLEDSREDGRALFGDRWAGLESDPDELAEFGAWVQQVRSLIHEGILSTDSLAALEDREPAREALREARERLGSYRSAMAEALESIGSDPERLFGDSLVVTEIAEVGDRLEALRGSVGQMDDWSTYVGVRDDVEATAAAPISQALGEGRFEPRDALPAWRGNLADTLLEHAFESRQALRGFSGDLHDKRVQRFRELDEEAIQRNRDVVRQECWNNRPHLVQGASDSSEAGVLVREFRKKQRHLSIRKLMTEAGSLVQDLKPCFMMSPLSVAKYLDPQKVRFDVVIFDEASQVRPQDALGAILRGDQLVVMGDPNQLPPTSFFEAVVERDEDETGVGSIVDLQSILDACEGTFPRRMLRWHYRSRHESLIAVSNSEFYDDRLVIYPSPYQGHADLGLEMDHRPETTYDRGGSRQNRGEARAVAEAALQHFRDNPDQSLGVGTFSSAQEEAIREEIEILRRKHPEMDPYVSEDEEVSPFGHEHFMIKNLETIQGDERDVIFVSVGYGFDDEGTLTQNFGPLNHDGGWRRLNVLITRARMRCVVFSNFTSEDLEISEKTPRGVRGLSRFLEYAEEGEAEGIDGSRGRPGSPLAEAVKSYLEDEGYTVHAQVGSAGFRVDLAVVDPDEPERYLLAIELDGEGYNDAPVARERDRLRRDVLEDRGWAFHHVWSADWYKSPETVQRRLLEAIEEAREADREAPVQTRAWEPATDRGDQAEPDRPEPEALEDQLVDLEELSQPYESVDELALPAYDEEALAEQPPELVSQLGEAVTELVQTEGPIHPDLVKTRIRDAWSLERTTPRLKEAVQAGIERASSLGHIEQADAFLWTQARSTIEPRRRTEAATLEIELIPDAEVAGAVDQILAHQRATPPGEVASQVASLLGFDRKGRRIAARVRDAIEDGLAADRYEQLEDGRIQAAAQVRPEPVEE